MFSLSEKQLSLTLPECIKVPPCLFSRLTRRPECSRGSFAKRPKVEVFAVGKTLKSAEQLPSKQRLTKNNPMTTCSQCGSLKREVNHWFIAWIDKGGQRFCITPLEADPVMAGVDGVLTLCGQWCLHQAIQKYTDSFPVSRKPILSVGVYSEERRVG
jgi:hypothetical protein